MSLIHAICAGCGRWFVADILLVKPEDPVACARCDIGRPPKIEIILPGPWVDPHQPGAEPEPYGATYWIRPTTKPGETP